MAYGLDFQEVYYADHQRVDIGVLETYEIDIDLADEKDFQIKSPDPVIPIGGYWYIQDTEYGGIVDAFHTDSDDEQIEYSGRSFRGILDSHIVDVKGLERTIPDSMTVPLDSGGAIDDDSTMLVATISDCFRELVTDFGDLFEVDEPDTDESISVTVPDYTIKAGTTVYEALMGLARSIDFTFTLEYRKDKKIHITPILIQDYTDYLRGSKFDGLGFQTEISTNVVNHLVCTAFSDETKELYQIHFFADENGGIQPYATVANPIKDSQYILDKRNQILTGIDEIAEYSNNSVSVTENWEKLASAPSDWNTNFGNYYKHEFDDDGREQWNPYEAVGNDVYTLTTSSPSDWSTNYSKYYTRRYDDREGKYVYSPVSAESMLDTNTAQKVGKPSDWKTHYSEYYYKFQTGTGIEYRSYSGVTKNKYVKMTKKPDDWDENYGSYYRKVYEKEVTENGKKKKKLIDTVNHKGAKYVNCQKGDDGKKGKKPKFSTRAHYRNDSYTVAPTYLKNNTYRIRSVEIAPTWARNQYYSMKTEYSAPKFVIGEAYRKVYDHYSDMAENAIDFFAEEKKKSQQRMELEDFEVNVGDIVGGTDEYTGTSVVGAITNIEANIESGLIDVSYSITVDDYTTKINANRQKEEDE